ncbi:MAG: hypothetical protein ACI3XS_02240 [Eubacteriales bacterium]
MFIHFIRLLSETNHFAPNGATYNIVAHHLPLFNIKRQKVDENQRWQIKSGATGKYKRLLIVGTGVPDGPFP